MTRLLSVAAAGLLGGTLLTATDPAPPAVDRARVADLIARLGDSDYARREAAEADLDAVGAPALDQLRAACRSANPEVARRAGDVTARIERRVANEKALAPTLVQLTTEDVPLAKALAQLSEQSGYSVMLWDGTAKSNDTIAQKKVTLATGKVPFWGAVLQVCDAADLQIASVGGFVAPGSAVPGSRAPTDRRVGQRPGRLPNQMLPGQFDGQVVQNANTIYLEPRANRQKRPAAVSGGVCVEAFPVPAAAAVPDAATTLLQVWAEPRVRWQMTSGAQVNRAADNAGQVLTALQAPATHLPQVVNRNGVAIVQNVQGRVILVNQNATVPAPGGPAFSPNARQALVSLKPGAKPSAELAHLTGVISGTVTSAAEPLIDLTGVAPGKSAEGTHSTGTYLKTTIGGPAEGPYTAEIELAYDTSVVRPANPIMITPPRMPPTNPARRPADSIYGIRVTDADGNAFHTGLTQTTQRVSPPSNATMTLRMMLHPTTKDQGRPARVTFWGIFARPVEAPFGLKNVPLAGGKK